MAKTLVLILGDQLSPGISALRDADLVETVILITEVADEAGYVRHHKKKIAFLFSAMRHFAEELRSAGWTVDYVRLDDTANSGSLSGEVLRAADRHGVSQFRVTEPGEWRVLHDLQALDTALDLEILPDDRFIASHAEFENWAEGRKALRMEYFYREMRRKTGLLMDGDKPAGGQWNFDHDNRKAAARDLLMPQPLRFAPDEITREVLDMVRARFATHFGTLEPLWFAATRADAEAAFAHFLKTALPRFGDYQDAMLAGEKFLYHAVVSLYLNCGLLDPLEMCRAVEAEYRAGRAPLNAAEGFIRQIIGWREYVRGIYWREGPDYVRRNALQATRPLPDFYWSADTEMACVKACVEQTRDEAYAHHIQRLMVTGNFALLAGIDPHELHEWYLAVYADAYEWVEAPNTVGMSQFADGGLLASKPYVASGAYIDRMSDYCRGCAYDVKAKAGPKACPFNYLYWDFIARHHGRLKRNPRMAQMVRTYDRFSDARKAEIETDSSRFLLSIETRNQEPL
ncbi:cryptochrome/photolyase family protein [Sphingorhabdus sp.]|jgi:deoxyribodipyrimidine photolyase-related protein|uniref:cryptochrome/photolyase family protein n=1 Tax=Sphingorhabdus sp. TaxID=1902408 RepID=UPI002CF5EA87|nr:cryptochrome/photolyase family protein [Sphingorhabdus sp.]HMT42511.1 cryptochrome/photolyase family protein [Sphingorhabdus sp.]